MGKSWFRDSLWTTALFSTAAVSGFDLVNESGPAVIILPAKAQESSKLAAKELADYTEKITGKRLPVVSEESAEKRQVIIGTLATLKDIPQSALKKLEAAKQREASYIYARGNTMYIIGKNEVAELYGTYHFMEDKLGIRWLKAANRFDSGEYVPKAANIVFPDYEEFREPAFAIRRLDVTGVRWNDIPVHGKTWANRNGYQTPLPYGGVINYDPKSKFDKERYAFYAPRIPFYDITHGGAHITFANPLQPMSAFDKHPEYFAMIDGKRVKGKQYCISNPDVQNNVAEYLISRFDKYHGNGRFTFGMVDTNTGWCECAQCRALDGGDTVASGFQNVSTRFNRAVKNIAAKVYAKYPNADLRIWAYHTYRQIPDNVRQDPRMSLEYCIHGRCYGHALDDPSCPRNVPLYKLLLEWRKIYSRINTYEYFTCTLPLYACHEKIQSHDLRLYRKLGLTGWKEEAHFEDGAFVKPSQTNSDKYPSNWQWLYITGKLLWNPDLDENKLLDEAESLYYGKAYSPMKKYQALRRKLWAYTPQCMGYPTGDQRRPYLLNASGVREELLRYLDEAANLAKGDETLQYRLGLDRRWLHEYWDKPNEKIKSGASRAFQAPRAKSKITIDGSGNDTAWVGAYYTDAFRKAFSEKHPSIPEQLKTTVGILSDDRNLYFLITAMEPHPEEMKLKAEKRDSSVWADDCCEIFLQPPSADTAYYQIAVNPKGVIYDNRIPGKASDFDMDIETKTKILKDRYIIELRVPVKNMKTIEEGDLWRINITRSRRVKDDLTPKTESGEGVFSIDGISNHDTSSYRAMIIGESCLRNGSLDDLDKNGQPKYWTVQGKNSKVVKAGNGYAVHLKDYGFMYQLLASGTVGQKPYPRKIEYSFNASGKGKLTVHFFRYTDTADPKAPNGYRRTSHKPHGIGGVYELTGNPQIITGQYTIEADQWCSFSLHGGGEGEALVDDLSIRLVK